MGLTSFRRQRLHEIFSVLERMAAVPCAPGLSELDHALQVATRAWEARAAPDLVLGGLAHDVGRLLRPEAHGEASAELVRPLVSEATYWVVRIHDELMLQFEPPAPGLRSDAARYAAAPWFPLARTFAERWDRHGFSPHQRPLPLEFFRPIVEDACFANGGVR